MLPCWVRLPLPSGDERLEGATDYTPLWIARSTTSSALAGGGFS